MEKLLLAAAIAYQFTEGIGSGRVVADGPRVRVEHLQGERVVSVWLTTDGGKTVAVLDPRAKTATLMNVDDLLGELTVSGTKATARDLGDGGTIEGYPTRKWAIDAACDLAVAGASVHLTLHSESWRTERIPGDAQIKATQLERLLPASVKGFPLKEVTTIRTKPPNGRETSATVTSAVHDVHAVTATPAMFAIPPGYKRQ